MTAARADLRNVTIATRPALLRDDLPGAGLAAIFLATELERMANWLRWPPFTCPIFAFEAQGLGFACEPADIAADMLLMAPDAEPHDPVTLFGFSGGSALAALVASAMTDLAAERPVRLILANPFSQWWPPPDAWRRPGTELVLALAAADPAFRGQLEARGDVVPALIRAKGRGLKLAILASGGHSDDLRRARLMSAALDVAVTEIPAPDHSLTHWLRPELHGQGGMRPGHMERVLARKRPREASSAAEMRAFWQKFGGLQAFADGL